MHKLDFVTTCEMATTLAFFPGLYTRTAEKNRNKTPYTDHLFGIVRSLSLIKRQFLPVSPDHLSGVAGRPSDGGRKNGAKLG
ncbi:MAG: hypothetical protein ABI200_03975, partial [Gaiellales bacterium]